MQLGDDDAEEGRGQVGGPKWRMAVAGGDRWLEARVVWADGRKAELALVILDKGEQRLEKLTRVYRAEQQRE